MAIRKPQKAVEKTGARYDELLAALNRQDSVPSPGTIVKGKVTGKRGNEILVDIGCKSAGAIPANEFENADEVKTGDEFDVLLIDLEGENGMVVVSKRQADEKIRWEAILAKYKEGDTVTGTIRGKVRGGMIVAVDGVDAFLPGSQVDVNPSRDLDIYITGEPQEFKIIKISDERRNIIVSRRELLEAQMAEKKHALLQTLQKGQIVHGKVKNITDFGAFVDLDGMDGLLHITDMSWGRIKHPSELLKVGQELDVMILDVDLERERVSLGLKQAQANPWDDITARYPVGSRLHGKVVNLAPYGRARHRGPRPRLRVQLDQAHRPRLRRPQRRRRGRRRRPQHRRRQPEDRPRHPPDRSQPLGHRPGSLPRRQPHHRQGPQLHHLRRLRRDGRGH